MKSFIKHLKESNNYTSFDEFWADRGMAIYKGSFQEVSLSDLKSALREAFNAGSK